MFESITRAISVFLGVLAAIALVAWGQNHWPTFAAPAKRAIAVDGYASILVPADKVDVSAAVVTAATSTGEALDRNNEIVAAVLAGLRADGVASKDIRTTGFTITPQHPKKDQYSDNELVTTGYIVKNSIVVTMDATAYSGKTVDRLVRLGANNIESVTFYVEKGEQFQSQARDQAAKDALARAKRTAEALGAKLGRVVSIGNPEVDYDERPRFRSRAAYASSVPVQTVSLMPSQQSFSETVSVTFELE
jgi:uncharacterized protein YggE